MKRLTCLLLALIMVFSLTACGTSTPASEPAAEPAASEQPAGPKVLKVAQDLTSIGNLNLHLSTYNQSFEIGNTICETLINKDPETLELYPLLLTKMPDISEDGLTYTFELKQGITFHDGSPLTSEDVVYTFNRFFNPDAGCLTTWLATMIKGSNEFLERKEDHLTGIKAIDDYHFTLELYYPYSAFSSVLAAAPLVIYPSDAAEAAGDRWGIDTFIGTGPFKVESFEPKTKVVLDRYDEYHGGAKKLDKIEIINMNKETALLEFEAGNVDVVGVETQLVDSYLNNPEYKDNVKFQEYLGIYTVQFNQDLAPLDNPKVREAVALATDRKAIVEGYFKGHVKPAKSLFPPGIPGYDASLPELPYDVEKAKALLAEAGYPNGVEIKATVTENSSFLNLLQILQQQYAKANITMNIELVDAAGWFDKRSTGNVQVMIMNWFADFNDPDNFIYSLYHSSSEDFLSTGNKDKEFDAALEKGRLITDPAEKQKFYADLEYKLTREKFATWPLYTPAGYYMVSDRAKNVFIKQDFLWWYSDADIVQ